MPLGLLLKFGLACLIATFSFMATTAIVQAQSSAAPRPSADTNPLFKPVPPEGNVTKIKLPRFSNLFDSGDRGETVIQKVVDFIINTLALVIGVTAFAYLIYGGFLYMTAGGSPDGVDQAKKTIRSAIVGIIIAAFSYLVVTYIIEQILFVSQ